MSNFWLILALLFLNLPAKSEDGTTHLRVTARKRVARPNALFKVSAPEYQVGECFVSNLELDRVVVCNITWRQTCKTYVDIWLLDITYFRGYPNDIRRTL